MRTFVLLFLAANLAGGGALAAAEEGFTINYNPPVQSLAGQAASADAGKESSTVNLLVQPGGFLQFGPIVELEFRLAPGVYLGAHIRFHGLGLLTHLIDLNYPEIWGLAGGAGIRVFVLPGATPEGFYVGGVVEVGVNGYYDNIGDPSAFHGTSVFMVSAANGGYRWRFDKFIVEVGAYAGIAPTLFSQYSYDSAPSVMINGNTLVWFFGMAEISIGWEL